MVQMQELYKKLKLLRIEKDLSQKELSEILGITTSAYGFYETGKRNPPFETIDKLSKFYNLPMEYFTTSSSAEMEQRMNRVIKNYIKINGRSPINPYANDSNSCTEYKIKNIKERYEQLIKENANDNWGVILNTDVKYEESCESDVIDVKEQDVHFSTPPKGLINTPKEINPNSLKESMDTLLIYANKCLMPELTDAQLDMIFDKTIDYIRYQLYQINRA